MKYRLIAYQFKFIEDRFLFPIIVNFDDEEKAETENVIIENILKKLQELPGLDNVRYIQNRIGTYDDLQAEFNSIMGPIELNNIKTIDVELHVVKKINYSEIDTKDVKDFNTENLHLPIRKLDNYNDIDITPFIVVDYLLD